MNSSLTTKYFRSFRTLTKKEKSEYFKDGKHQREFLHNLFLRLNFTSFEDWKKVENKLILQYDGGALLQRYNKNFQHILRAVFPNYAWRFEDPFDTHAIRRKFLDDLQGRLGICDLLQWTNVSPRMIAMHGGESLLRRYDYNMKRLLQDVFPHVEWKFKRDSKSKGRDVERSVEKRYGRRRNELRSAEKVKEYLNELFVKSGFCLLDEWLKVGMKEKLKRNKGVQILLRHDFDQLRILQFAYPNYPWNERDREIRAKKYVNDVNAQRSFMIKLFTKFKLTSLNDFKSMRAERLRREVGGNAILAMYSGRIAKLLETLFPNYPWEFQASKKEWSLRKYFEKSMKNQRDFMEEKFCQWGLKYFEDWKKVPKRRIVNEGGKLLLLSMYTNDMKRLLSSIYPNYPWSFSSKYQISNRQFYAHITNQRQLLNDLFNVFQLRSLEDWLYISNHKITKHGGYEVLAIYKYNKHEAIRTIYPNYPWDEVEKNGPSRASYLATKLLTAMKYYQIREKQDWYRVPIESALLRYFKIFFKEEQHALGMNFRSNKNNKRSNQRIAMIATMEIFPSLLCLENYRHPRLTNQTSNPWEIDIYIPSISLGLEYQGQQHFEDIYSWGCHQRYLFCDPLKISLAAMNGITLLTVPYWWDLSVSSLFSSIYLTIMNDAIISPSTSSIQQRSRTSFTLNKNQKLIY